MKAARICLIALLSSLWACTSYYAGVQLPAENTQLLQIAYRRPPLMITSVNGVHYGFTLNWAFHTNPGRNDIDVLYSLATSARSSIGSDRPIHVRAEGAAGTAVLVCERTAADWKSFRVHYYSIPFQLSDDHEGKRLMDAICEMYDWVSEGRNLDVRRAIKWGVPLSLRRSDGVTLADHIRHEAKARNNPELLEVLTR